MSERLHKVLADRGVASRRKAEAMIGAARVTVNGVTAQIGQQVESIDVIIVDGIPVDAGGERVYIALNKPGGVISATSATHGDATVVELVSIPQRIYPVGRLDKDSSGLLFLTNDGDWSNLVTHPRHQVEKEYNLLAEGALSESDLARLQAGVALPDGTVTAPARVERLGGLRENSRFSVTVVEGKKRQIRLMFAAVGHPVVELKRIRIGPIELGDLAIGAWRRLDPEEVALVRNSARRPAPPGTSPRSSRSDRRTGLSR